MSQIKAPSSYRKQNGASKTKDSLQKNASHKGSSASKNLISRRKDKKVAGNAIKSPELSMFAVSNISGEEAVASELYPTSTFNESENSLMEDHLTVPRSNFLSPEENWIYWWYLSNVLPSCSCQVWYSIQSLKKRRKIQSYRKVIAKFDGLKLIAIKEYFKHLEETEPEVYVFNSVPVSHNEMAKLFVELFESNPSRDWHKEAKRLMASTRFCYTALDGTDQVNGKNVASNPPFSKLSATLKLSVPEKINLFAKVNKMPISPIVEWMVTLLEELHCISEISNTEDDVVENRRALLNTSLAPASLQPKSDSKQSYTARRRKLTECVLRLDTEIPFSGSEVEKGVNSFNISYSTPVLRTVTSMSKTVGTGKKITLQKGKNKDTLATLNPLCLDDIMKPNFPDYIYQQLFDHYMNVRFAKMQGFRKRQILTLIESGVVQHSPLNQDKLVSSSNDICSASNYDKSAIYEFLSMPSQLAYSITTSTNGPKCNLSKPNRDIGKGEKLEILNSIFKENPGKAKQSSTKTTETILSTTLSKSYSLKIVMQPEYFSNERKAWYNKWTLELASSKICFVDQFPAMTTKSEEIFWEELQRLLELHFRHFQTSTTVYTVEEFGLLKLPPPSLKTRYVLLRRDCALKPDKNPRLWDYGKAIRFLKDMGLETGTLHEMFRQLQEGSLRFRNKRRACNREIKKYAKKVKPSSQKKEASVNKCNHQELQENSTPKEATTIDKSSVSYQKRIDTQFFSQNSVELNASVELDTTGSSSDYTAYFNKPESHEKSIVEGNTTVIGAQTKHLDPLIPYSSKTSDDTSVSVSEIYLLGLVNPHDETRSESIAVNSSFVDGGDLIMTQRSIDPNLNAADQKDNVHSTADVFATAPENQLVSENDGSNNESRFLKDSQFYAPFETGVKDPQKDSTQMNIHISAPYVFKKTLQPNIFKIISEFVEAELKRLALLLPNISQNIIQLISDELIKFISSKIMEENDDWYALLQERDEMIRILSSKLIETEKHNATYQGKLLERTTEIKELRKLAFAGSPEKLLNEGQEAT